MPYILLITFGLIVCIGVLRRELTLQFPTFTALITLLFFFPQFVAIETRESSIYATDRSIFMVWVCAIAIFLGYYLVSPEPYKSNPSRRYSQKKLLIGAWLLLTIGLVAAVILNLRFDKISGRITGAPVALLFFARCRFYAIAISLFIYLQNKSRASGICFLISTLSVLDRLIIAGKRGNTAEVVIIILVALWFAKRIQIPRALYISLFAIGLFALYGVTAYRVSMRGSVENGNVIDRAIIASRAAFSPDTIKRIFDDNPAYEAKNAIVAIERINITNRIDFGASIWNDFVFTYVPAQLLSQEFKKSLFMENGSAVLAAYREVAYQKHPGTTLTGPATAFGMFGFFGASLFFIQGVFMRRLYDRSMSNNFESAIWYSLLVVPGMLGMTHSVFWAIMPIPHMLFFLYPFLRWARLDNPKRQRNATASMARPISTNPR